MKVLCVNSKNNYNLESGKIYSVLKQIPNPKNLEEKFYILKGKNRWTEEIEEILASSERFIELGEIGELVYE